MNLALSVAKYSLFLYTDADAIFEPNAIKIACGYFEDPVVGGVGGALKVRNPDDSLITKAQQLNYMFAFTIERRALEMLNFYFVASGAFGIFRTNILRGVGGFRYASEDSYASLTTRLAGWKVRFSPFSCATVIAPKNLSKFFKQRTLWNSMIVSVFFFRFFRALLNPFNHNFQLSLSISIISTFFFEIVMPIIITLYIIIISILYNSAAFNIVLSVSFIYIVISYINLISLFCLLDKESRDYKLFIYTPVFFFVDFTLLRFIRIYAYWSELIFSISLNQGYIPKKIGKIRKY